MLFTKFVIILITLFIQKSMAYSSISIEQQPFEKNLRIMSFSNINGSINESEYYQGGDSISIKGIEKYPIVSNSGLKKHYHESRKKFMGGGMINLAKLIELKRIEADYNNTIVIDAGGSLINDDINGENFKNLISLHIDMGVDVLSIGNELINGEKQIINIAKEYESSNVGIISTNILDDGGFLFNPFKEFSFGDKKIVLIGHSNTHITKDKIFKSGFSVNQSLDNLKKMVKYFVEDEYFVILISSNSISHNIEIAKKIPGIKIIIGGSDGLELPHPTFVQNDLGNTLVVTSGSNGMFLSTLDINLDSKNMDEFKYKLIPTISKEIKTKLQGYNFFFGKEKFSFKNVYKTNKNLLVGSIKMGSLDSLLLQIIFDKLKPDLIIGSPPLGKINILANRYITEEHLFKYFGMKKNKIIDSFIVGDKIKELIHKYYNNNNHLANGNYMNIRHFGIDFEVIHGNKENLIKIKSINNKPFDGKTKYRLVGWGDWISNNPSGMLIEDFVMNELSTSK